MKNQLIIEKLEKKINKLLKEFKKENHLDFRKNRNNYYIHSNYCNRTGGFCYDFAKKIVLNLNSFLAERFGEQKVRFNIEMDIERLKNETLEDYIQDRIYNYCLDF